MFHKEFYPTPASVLHMMGIDSFEKTVLDPSVGKGDIIDFCLNQGCGDTFGYEVVDDLRTIAGNKCNLIGTDFLKATAEDVSHIQLIVMNPPFSNADKHIIHAYNIAPEGCEIIALCNYETISKDYRYGEINRLLRDYGSECSLGSCFDTAERKTNVEIGLIKLFKPMVNSTENFDGFYFDLDEEVAGQNGVMRHDEVYALVQRYVGAVMCFDKLDVVKKELEYTLNPLGINEISLTLGYDEKVTTKESFSKMLQKRSWKHIFDKMNMSKYVTSGTMSDINKFVEQQQKYPFTVKNVYRMFEIIVGTRQQTMNKALEEVIDNFTKYTSENRFGVEGWKTNSGYMLNKKFIISGAVSPSWGNSDILNIEYNSRAIELDDLTKVLCTILGENYDDIKGVRDHFNNGLERNVWYSWGYFEVKVFKKGTMHLRFKDENSWYRLNKAYGELKGFTLSSDYN